MFTYLRWRIFISGCVSADLIENSRYIHRLMVDAWQGPVRESFSRWAKHRVSDVADSYQRGYGRLQACEEHRGPDVYMWPDIGKPSTTSPSQHWRTGGFITRLEHWVTWSRWFTQGTRELSHSSFFFDRICICSSILDNDTSNPVKDHITCDGIVSGSLPMYSCQFCGRNMQII